jgi:hypothetical protein
MPKILDQLGLSLMDLIQTMESADPAAILESRQRKQIEAILGFGDLRVLLNVFEELGINQTHG